MSRWGDAATGAVQGGATGAIGGPWGAAGGAVVGAISGLFGGGKKKKKKGSSGYSGGSEGIDIQQLANMSPEQMKLFQQEIQSMGPESHLAKLAGGDEEAFAQMEEPAMRQFNQLLGKTASRFSGSSPGQLSGRRSSAFHNENTQATSDFVSQLRSQRMQLQQQAVKDLHGMRNDLLSQRPYQYAQGGSGSNGGGGSFFDQLTSGFLPKFAGGVADELVPYGISKWKELFSGPATPSANPSAGSPNKV